MKFSFYIKTRYYLLILLSVSIFSSLVTAIVIHSKRSPTTKPFALPENSVEKNEKTIKEITPDKALHDALKAIVDHKYKMFDKYKITMSQSEDKLSWRIWFVSIPESPGKDFFVSVANDGSISILPGF